MANMITIQPSLRIFKSNQILEAFIHINIHFGSVFFLKYDATRYIEAVKASGKFHRQNFRKCYEVITSKRSTIELKHPPYYFDSNWNVDDDVELTIIFEKELNIAPISTTYHYKAPTELATNDNEFYNMHFTLPVITIECPTLPLTNELKLFNVFEYYWKATNNVIIIQFKNNSNESFELVAVYANKKIYDVNQLKLTIITPQIKSPATNYNNNNTNSNNNNDLQQKVYYITLNGNDDTSYYLLNNPNFVIDILDEDEKATTKNILLTSCFIRDITTPDIYKKYRYVDRYCAYEALYYTTSENLLNSAGNNSAYCFIKLVLLCEDIKHVISWCRKYAINEISNTNCIAFIDKEDEIVYATGGITTASDADEIACLNKPKITSYYDSTKDKSHHNYDLENNNNNKNNNNNNNNNTNHDKVNNNTNYKKRSTSAYYFNLISNLLMEYSFTSAEIKTIVDMCVDIVVTHNELAANEFNAINPNEINETDTRNYNIAYKSLMNKYWSNLFDRIVLDYKTYYHNSVNNFDVDIASIKIKYDKIVTKIKYQLNEWVKTSRKQHALLRQRLPQFIGNNSFIEFNSLRLIILCVYFRNNTLLNKLLPFEIIKYICCTFIAPYLKASLKFGRQHFASDWGVEIDSSCLLLLLDASCKSAVTTATSSTTTITTPSTNATTSTTATSVSDTSVNTTSTDSKLVQNNNSTLYYTNRTTNTPKLFGYFVINHKQRAIFGDQVDSSFVGCWKFDYTSNSLIVNTFLNEEIISALLNKNNIEVFKNEQYTDNVSFITIDNNDAQITIENVNDKLKAVSKEYKIFLENDFKYGAVAARIPHQLARQNTAHDIYLAQVLTTEINDMYAWCEKNIACTGSDSGDWCA